MFGELIVLLTAFSFLSIGYYLGRKGVRRPRAKEPTIDDIVDKIKSEPIKKIKPGVIPFKTQEDWELERNGDKDLEREWIKSGKADLIRETK